MKNQVIKLVIEIQKSNCLVAGIQTRNSFGISRELRVWTAATKYQMSYSFGFLLPI